VIHVTDVVLKNITKHPKRMLTFNLTRAEGSVKVTNRVTVETRDGERRQKTTSKLVPDSLRIAHGETSRALPESVLLVPDVAKAITKRELLVQKAPKDVGPKPEKKPAPVKAPPAPPPPADEAEPEDPAEDGPAADKPKGRERTRRG
jgi:hypothetical protein